jgi:hypothetical protein
MIISDRMFKQVNSYYKKRYNLEIKFLDPSGAVIYPEPHSSIENHPAIKDARFNAIKESVRWGEPNVFLLPQV